MPVSKPLQMFAVRLSDEDRALLEAKAAERHITLSHAIREGLRLYCQEARDAVQVGGQVARR